MIDCQWIPSARETSGYDCARCGRYSYDAQAMQCRAQPGTVKDDDRPEPQSRDTPTFDQFLERAEAAEQQAAGLGDAVEAQLKKWGITEERYKEIKERFGLPPTCGCSGRKAWLNDVGRYFGIG